MPVRWNDGLCPGDRGVKMVKVYEVEWEWKDCSCGRTAFDTYADVRLLLDDFRDEPVRVWVDGEMVQRGFVARDEIRGY